MLALALTYKAVFKNTCMTTFFLSVCSKFKYSQRDLSPDNVTQVSIPYPQHSWMTYLFAYLLSLSNPHPKIGCNFEGNSI